MTTHDKKPARRSRDPEGDLIHRALEQGRVTLRRAEQPLQDSPFGPQDLLDFDAVEPTHPEQPDLDEPKSPGPGRPARRANPSTKRVSLRLTESELGVIHAAAQGSNSDYMRAALLAYAELMTKDDTVPDHIKQEITRALEAYHND